jgi:MFS family permease
MLETRDLLYIGGAVILSVIIGYILKIIFPKIKKPNGKRGGIISFHIILGMSLISSIGYITHDYIYTGLMSVLVYLIIRNKYESKQHYTYQITLSMIIGILPIVGLVYKEIIKKKNNRIRFEEDHQIEAMREAPELDLHSYEKNGKDKTDTSDVDSIHSMHSIDSGS